MIESEGVTENVGPWRTDVPAKFIDEIGLEKLMFEAADPDVFAWYIKKLRCGRESLCRSQPDSATGMPARRHLGDEEFVGAGSDIQRMTKHE
jgi:hypothetical protein